MPTITGPITPPPVTPNPHTNELAKLTEFLGTKSPTIDNIKGNALNVKNPNSDKRIMLGIFRNVKNEITAPAVEIP